ncbi:MAG: hypothetical protein NC123_15240 [Butyrivibrio sp.]|nr:hypothetical protein [Acetatifactor muris]MCM1560875.1 hypothetical protein [Butyrivibrio sp.]
MRRIKNICEFPSVEYTLCGPVDFLRVRYYDKEQPEKGRGISRMRHMGVKDMKHRFGRTWRSVTWRSVKILAAGAALACVLSACTLRGGAEAPDNVVEGGGQQVPFSPEESYRTVLLEDGEFISTDLQGRKLKLRDIKEAVTEEDGLLLTAGKFTALDLDADGTQEIVLWLTVNGISDYGFAVLKYLEGEVYGYTLPYRSFMNLKEDGSFAFSGGAADSGIGQLSFSEETYTVEELYYSKSEFDFQTGELTVQCYLKGAYCTEESYEDGMRRQEEKTDAVWYDLTADNVNSALGF